MIDKILFSKYFDMPHCQISFIIKSISGSHIFIDNYSFIYDFEADKMEFIADLLDKVYYRLKQNIKSTYDVHKLEQYDKLQSVLLEILN